MGVTRLLAAVARMLTACRRITEESILAVQIFDQKKFKKKDQGFLGVVNVRIGSVMDLDAGGDGKVGFKHGHYEWDADCRRNAHARPAQVQRQSRREW